MVRRHPQLKRTSLMKVIPLAPQDAMFGPATHKVIITSADVAALGAGLTGNFQMLPVNLSGVGSGTCPAGTIVRLTGSRVTTNFTSSGAMSSLVFTVGDSGVNNRFLTSTQVL